MKTIKERLRVKEDFIERGIIGIDAHVGDHPEVVLNMPYQDFVASVFNAIVIR